VVIEFTGFAGLAESFGLSGKSVGWPHDGGFFRIRHWYASAVVPDRFGFRFGVV
jgi:hypothetical protein